MDPIQVAEFVREIAAGVFFVLFSAAFGVTIAPITMSHDTDDRCSDVSYVDPSIVASSLVFFASTFLLCASSIKVVYKRPSDGKPEANSLIAWRLVYALIPLAVVTFILAYIFFVIVLQLRLGKIGCWSSVAHVLVFGPCMIAVIMGLIFIVICYRNGRDAGHTLEGANTDDDAFFTHIRSFAATRYCKYHLANEAL